MKDALGFPLCRMPACGKRVGKGRRSYCSADCAAAFEVAYFPSATRRHVFRRDRGVCAACGRDTAKVQRILRAIRTLGEDRHRGTELYWWAARLMGFPNALDDGHFWQADHVHEVVRGGWGVGLEKLRTLCTPCHRSETARLAAELAAERRDKARGPNLFAAVPEEANRG